ncbi:MAG: YiiX/YebB-like N1pC/P60 family cysteine hydrolase [Planctomycetales bacterium]
MRSPIFALRLRSAPWVFCLLALLAVAGGKKVPTPEIDLSEYDFRDGDIVFQHLPSKLGSMIREVTDSPYSHCGMIAHRHSKPYVLEAIGPVRYLPLREWLKQGDRSQFAQMRLKEVTDEQIAAAIRAAEKFLGRPYDIQYELDDEKIYCSELVYKGYLRGAGLEVGKQETLGELKWEPHEAFIRAITGGPLPLQRVMVTPAAVANSPDLKLLYSNFPARRDDPTYSRNDLAGTWRGDYSIRALAPASVQVELDKNGAFDAGTIQLVDGSAVPIRQLEVAPFARSREFTARLTDARGFDSEVRGRVLDEARRIVGTWSDGDGYRGVFSLERQE